MSEIVIYTKDWCGYCRAAKQLLSKLGYAYSEVDVTYDRERFDEMVRLADGRQTVPQIFVNGRGIGGFTDLYRLVDSGNFPPAEVPE